MQKLLFLMLLMGGLACSNSSPTENNANQPDQSALLSEIQAIEAEFEAKPDKVINKEKAKVLVEKSKLYVTTFPKDTLNPKLLFRAGEVARFIRDFDQAIFLMGLLYREYPDNVHSPPALFLQAFMYENNLNDKENAKKYYNHFLNKIPRPRPC